MIHGLLEVGENIVLQQIPIIRNTNFSSFYSSAFRQLKALNLALVSFSMSLLLFEALTRVQNTFQHPKPALELFSRYTNADD